MKRLGWVIFLSFVWAIAHGQELAQPNVSASENAKAFLKKYMEYFNANNSQLANLYADDAEVYMTVDKEKGQAKKSKLSGKLWKQVLRDYWALGRTAKETIELRNITVAENSGLLEITADRYSKTRCYWDNGYRLTLKAVDKEYCIIKEQAYSNLINQCPPLTLEEYLINQNIEVR